MIVAFCLLNMKKFNSIKKNSDFQKVYRTGRSFANKLLVMYVIKTEREDTRIGISVSKKVGNSVVRHHITRLVLGPSSKVSAILGGSSTGSPAVVSVEKSSKAVAFADACFTRESIPGPASEVRNCVRLSAEEKSRKKIMHNIPKNIKVRFMQRYSS